MSLNIYKIAKPLYYVCKYTGFACFSIKGNIKDGKIHSTYYDVTLFLFFSGFYINNIIMSLEIDSYNGSSVILDIGTYTNLLVSLLAALIFAVTSFVQRHSIWSILQYLDQFDEYVELLAISVNQKKHQKYLLIFIITTGMLKAIHIGSMIYDGGNNISLKHLIIYLTNFSFFIQIISIQLLLISINLRQNHLFRCIENFFQLENGKVKYVTVKGINPTINSISNLCSKLNESIDAFNKSYGLISAICFTLYFAYGVFSLFTVFRSVGYREITFYSISKTSYLSILYTSYVLATIHIACKIAEKV